MPRLDGATLYSGTKQVRPEFVAIMVTAYAGVDGGERAKEAGIWKGTQETSQPQCVTVACGTGGTRVRRSGG